MTDLPGGTVTLVFTDLEGSTRLQHQMGDAYQSVVAEHRRLLENAFAEHHGVVVDRQTESFFVVFARARDAVDGATVAQQALAAHEWPGGAQVKVRMGIHSGEPEVVGDRYVGLAVSRAARICGSAHGGQVLLSAATRALLSDDDRSTLRDLGPHRLKDFTEPETISQLVFDGVPERFPPLNAEPAPSRRRWPFAAAAVAVVALAAVAVLALTNSGSGTVKVGPTSVGVIDPRTNKVTAAVSVGFETSLIAAGEGYVWVVDPTGGTLVRIDPRTRATLEVPLAVGAGGVTFGVAAGDGAVWVAVIRKRRPTVLELGPQVGNLLRAIPYGGSGNPDSSFHGERLAVGDGAVWAVDPTLGGVWRISAGGAVRRVVDGLDARGLAVGNDALWVAGSSGLAKVDPLDGNDLGFASTGTRPVAETASVALGAHATWFTTSSERVVAQVDPEAASTTQTFPVGRGPNGIAVGAGSVWVACSRDGTVWRIDPRTGRRRVITVGYAPGGLVSAFGSVWTAPGQPHA